MAKEIKNIGASVHARLLLLAKASGQSFELVLTASPLSGHCSGSARSRHADRFVLRGAISDDELVR